MWTGLTWPDSPADFDGLDEKDKPESPPYLAAVVCAWRITRLNCDLVESKMESKPPENLICRCV